VAPTTATGESVIAPLAAGKAGDGQEGLEADRELGALPVRATSSPQITASGGSPGAASSATSAASDSVRVDRFERHPTVPVDAEIPQGLQQSASTMS
jgi:hypothetical protein